MSLEPDILEYTHLEPDILEYKVKWALRSITTNNARGGDGIPVTFSQTLGSVVVLCFNLAVATGLEKVSFHLIPKKGNGKEYSNYCTTALISHASKVMLIIL